MKPLFILLCSLLFMRGYSQNIIAAEYFFDTDPGPGLGTPIVIGSPGTTVNFTTLVPTTSMSSGFHTLAIRTRDANGIWSLFETRALYISSSTTNTSSIVAAEYFIDTDPGTGGGSPLSVGTSGNTVNFAASIPTAALSNGFHFLAIRTQNADGVWSHFESRGFYISASTLNAPAITAAEYFIDADPGIGNGTAMNIGTSGNTVNFSASIPTTSLPVGFHMLAIRSRDANGLWSLFEVRPFYISGSTSNTSAIVAAEYFIDADPGTGNGTALAVGPAGNTVNFTAAIPTASLANGFHTLAIRTRNLDGEWSLFETRPFYISTGATDMTAITAAEYFIDADPGVGNGSPLSITTPGNTVNQTFLVNVPVGTANGTHLLAIRTRDANGVWSLFELDDFEVTGSVLPLDWISFTGNREGKKIRLQWITENEINTSHFEVQRSVNGVNFEKIGTAAAKGQTNNDYTFYDEHPVQGLNFYRLQQYDLDGKSKFSLIVKVFYGEDLQQNLQLYPNPVRDRLTLEFEGTGKILQIQVYDAGGKMIMSRRMENNGSVTLPVQQLANGSYWIEISDGLKVQRGSFIKN